MEFREDGLIVDYSGAGAKQEQELGALSQETRLMRAMNEIRQYAPKRMSPYERQMFDAFIQKIFEKHGVRPETYAQEFGHLGTPQNLHR